MPTKLTSYGDMVKDRNLLKRTLFSDNSDHAMVANTTLIGIHNKQLQSKYKLSAEEIDNMYGTVKNKLNSNESIKADQNTDRENKGSTTNKPEKVEEIIRDAEIAQHKATEQDEDDNEILMQDDNQDESVNNENSQMSDNEPTHNQNQSRTIELEVDDVYALTRTEKKLRPTPRSQQADTEDENDIELTVEDEDLEQEETQLTNEIADDILLEAENSEDSISDAREAEKAIEDAKNKGDESRDDKQRKLSWGIPKALRLLRELDSFTGITKDSDQKNLRDFPDYLTKVRECITHAMFLTAGHPTFQTKIGHLLKDFLRIRATEWEANSYGQRSDDDMSYFSELMLNKVNTLDAYEKEVKKLFDTKEKGHQTFKQVTNTALRTVARAATFGLSELLIRHNQKKDYKDALDEKKETRAEQKIKKLEYKNDKKKQKLDEDIAELRSEYHHTKLGKKIGEWKIKRKEDQKKNLDTKLNEKTTKINKKKSEDGLTKQIAELKDKIADSSGIFKIYYKCRKHSQEKQLEKIRIKDKIQKQLSEKSNIQAAGFATAMDEDAGEEEKAEAVANSINVSKNVHSKIQKKADPRNHEHLAMALHLLDSNIRDADNENPFYTAEYDSKKISSLIETYEEPYYDDANSSSSKDAFDKFELREDTNSNKLLQRMLAVIMVFANENLLTNAGIKLVFSGEKPEIFDVANNGNKVWEKNSFKLGTDSYINLLSNCKRISDPNQEDKCYTSFKTIFEEKIFNNALKGGMSRDNSKDILKCFCGTSSDSEAQRIYDMLMQPECSFRNIQPLLNNVYAVKNPGQKN